jgi:hypothetical protein
VEDNPESTRNASKSGARARAGPRERGVSGQRRQLWQPPGDARAAKSAPAYRALPGAHAHARGGPAPELEDLDTGLLREVFVQKLLVVLYDQAGRKNLFGGTLKIVKNGPTEQRTILPGDRLSMLSQEFEPGRYGTLIAGEVGIKSSSLQSVMVLSVSR